MRIVGRGEKTYGHFVEALCAGVAVEEGTVLCPDAVDAEGREIGLVRRTCHRWVVDHEIGFAGIDVESPDASQECICDEDEVVGSVKTSHAV